MEHQSDEDGKKWAQQLNNPLPGQPESPEDDRESLAAFKKFM
jgi:hypothetical protein